MNHVRLTTRLFLIVLAACFTLSLGGGGNLRAGPKRPAQA